MRLLEKSGTLQILDSLKESSMKEDVSDLVNNEDDVLLGSVDEDGVDVSDRKPIAGFYAGRGNADPGIEIYEIDYNTDDRVLARDLARLDEKEQAHWYTIEYEFEDEDGNELEEPRAYIDVDGIKVYMDECMRINLHEAEEIIDIFANPERDYKITDVTMLEPIDDGDVRAIDMQSILIGLDESLTEKYGENWGEFNIQSSRTPRGKIDENDISYVLHVLDINGHQEILNYNTKGTGRIREAFITNYKGKVLESKRCTLNRIPKFFMEATEAYIKKYNEEALKEDAVLPNNGYIDQTGLNLVSDERIQNSLRRRVQRLKARQKLLKAKKTFGKDGNVAPVDEKNTHGKEVTDSDIGEETKPITDTKIKESVVTLDTDNGTVDIDGNVSHVTLDQDGTMTAVSEGEIITTTDNSVEVLPSEETMIADDSILEPNGEDLPAEDINTLEEPEMPENEPEMAPEEAGDTIETGDIAMAEPVPASELEESVEEDAEDTELWCRGKVYWTGNHNGIDENLLLDIADQAAEEEGEPIDVDEVEIKKIEESLKESSEDIDKFWSSDIKAGDKVMSSGAGEVEVLDLDKGKDYILIKRNTDFQPFVAAWAPQLDDEGKLFWGQGHYFDTEEEARKYFKSKLAESVKENKKLEEMGRFSDRMDKLRAAGDRARTYRQNVSDQKNEKIRELFNRLKEIQEDVSDLKEINNHVSLYKLKDNYNIWLDASGRGLDYQDPDDSWNTLYVDTDKIQMGEHMLETSEITADEMTKPNPFHHKNTFIKLATELLDIYPEYVRTVNQMIDEYDLKYPELHESLKEEVEEKSGRYTEEESKKAKELFGVDADDFIEKIYATKNPEEMLKYLETLPDTDFKKECLDSFDYYEDHDDITFESGEYKDLIADALDTMINNPNWWKEKVARGGNGKRFTEAVEEKVKSDIEGEDTEEVIEEDLVPSAIFHRKCSNTEDMKREEENKVVTAKSTYVVKDVKEVDEGEFNDLSSNLLKDRDYIKEFADNVEVDNSVAFNCLEVRGPQGSLLIDPSGYGYARYCAFGEGTNTEEPVEEVEVDETSEEPVEGEEE